MRHHAWLYIIIALLIITIGFILFGARTQAPAQPTEQSASPVPSTPTVMPAQKSDFIKLTTPLPGTTVSSPLTITGEARGTWFFEGSFPIILTDWDGKIIAQGHATAQGNWMTSDFVPFTASITYTKPDVTVSNRGALILKKDNPSDDPKNDDALEVEIRY